MSTKHELIEKIITKINKKPRLPVEPCLRGAGFKVIPKRPKTKTKKKTVKQTQKMKRKSKAQKIAEEIYKVMKLRDKLKADEKNKTATASKKIPTQNLKLTKEELMDLIGEKEEKQPEKPKITKKLQLGSMVVDDNTGKRKSKPTDFYTPAKSPPTHVPKTSGKYRSAVSRRIQEIEQKTKEEKLEKEILKQTAKNIKDLQSSTNLPINPQTILYENIPGTVPTQSGSGYKRNVTSTRRNWIR